MMKKVKLSEIKKEQIWDWEKQVANIAKEIEGQFQQNFKSHSYKLEIVFSRTDVSPKHFPECPPLSKEQCLKPHYCSAISVAVTDLEGNLIGDEEDGYLFGEGLTIWTVEKSFLFFMVDENFPIGSAKGYILTLPSSEIKKTLEEDVFYLAKELNIPF
ncbi:hypothetical protein [Neobacillus niacini]|uniref:hypothetical protein n=1 Tax=Neobacillus niacini TaxID=86668 RepID=UPI00285A0C92|nr:hypothetical protein [Neobacillus niacini]MDR7003002.1 hypothetical protein [Neobacillus niacini]